MLVGRVWLTMRQYSPITEAEILDKYKMCYNGYRVTNVGDDRMSAHLSLKPLLVKVKPLTIITVMNIDHSRVLCQAPFCS